ncbi:MAG: cobalt-precorrin-5B (C(1))-methyltransferase [Spirulinaceae cyanobacterium SM2_1_0]|nr:cobalt-precorrin-5B (C(1))-methyltransferase [Spirulinaceae cyanobacterium SM2_1_0]
MARTGYTLPVFAVAAAKAALLHLQGDETPLTVRLDLLPDAADIPIEQVAGLNVTSALAIARSDPGDNLDLTRDTPIWAWVNLEPRQGESLILTAGEGVGKLASGEPAIYDYARRLFAANLSALIPGDRTLRVAIILPAGRQLAQRTSNEAFGVLEGLSLLGTSGISKPFSVAEHLEDIRQDLRAKVGTQSNLVFCIGSHGLQVAQQLEIPAAAIVQTGNWLGALLVEAGLRGATSVLLLGYQGKLIKLAGGIFNTSSHLADGKLEIISAATLTVSDNLAAARTVLAAPTADAAYQALVSWNLAQPVFNYLAQNITTKAQAYVAKYADTALPVGAILFDRQGQIIAEHTSYLDSLTPRR